MLANEAINTFRTIHGKDLHLRQKKQFKLEFLSFSKITVFSKGKEQFYVYVYN